jgi:hypothetical protein
MFENRNYIIIQQEDVHQVDFNELLDSSIDTCIFSVDKKKLIVKWEGETIVNSIDNLQVKEGPYSQEEILNILRLEYWNEPITFP